MSAVNKIIHPFDKTRLDALLNRRFFYAPAFEIYGGMRLVIFFMLQQVISTPSIYRRRWPL